MKLLLVISMLDLQCGINRSSPVFCEDCENSVFSELYKVE
jgi:hypothetical protein